jgi:hypothetical protein
MINPRRAFAVNVTVVLTAATLVASVGVGSAIAATTPPPTATTGPVTAVLPTSATVAGDVNPNGASTKWYFQFGPSTDASFGSITSVGDAGAGTKSIDVTASTTGLSPSTSYHYRIVAINASGTSYGGSGVFNTTAAPTVLTSAASSLTASSATLNGLVSPQDQTTSWYFEYGATTAYGSKTSSKTLAASANQSAVSAVLSGLAPQATYHFRLIASSGAGKTYGLDAKFTTGLPVTMNSNVSAIVYGGMVTLSGVVASGLANARVTLESQGYAQSSFTGFATVVTGSAGVWSYSAEPASRTTYEAVTNGGTSSSLVVGVRPAVYLTLVSGGRISTHVVAAVPFGAHVLQLQRLSGGNWVQWKQVRLNANAKATFSTSLPLGRTEIRMAIGPFVLGIDQAAPGYLAGFSRSVSYLRR